ncbi:hypothetical protein T439DRAFT_222975 [Meredithblackwellia eburnea MCA 4105]
MKTKSTKAMRGVEIHLIELRQGLVEATRAICDHAVSVPQGAPISSSGRFYILMAITLGSTLLRLVPVILVIIQRSEDWALGAFRAGAEEESDRVSVLLAQLAAAYRVRVNILDTYEEMADYFSRPTKREEYRPMSLLQASLHQDSSTFAKPP